MKHDLSDHVITPVEPGAAAPNHQMERFMAENQGCDGVSVWLANGRECDVLFTPFKRRAAMCWRFSDELFEVDADSVEEAVRLFWARE